MDIINKTKKNNNIEELINNKPNLNAEENISKAKKYLGNNNYLPEEDTYNSSSSLEAMSNFVNRTPSWWETFKLQWQDGFDNGLTSTIVRNSPLFDEQEKESIGRRVAQETEERQELLERSNSWTAKLVGGVTSSLSDPTELAALALSGGASSLVTKGMATGIGKRLATNALTGLGFGAMYEGIKSIDKYVDHGDPIKNIAMHTIAFPVLGEAAHGIGKIFGMSIPKNKSNYLNSDLKKINNISNKQYIDESLIDYKKLYEEKYHAELGSIISNPKNKTDDLIKDVESLQKIKESVRHDFSNKSEPLKDIALLEDKELLTDKESALLDVLKKTHLESVLERDNLTKIIDSVIVNRKIQHDGLYSHPVYESLVEKQINEGVEINTHNPLEKKDVIPQSKMSEVKKNIESEIVDENVNPMLSDAIKKTEAYQKEIIDKEISQLVEEKKNVWKYQLQKDQQAANKLYESVSKYKDLRNASRVAVDMRDNLSNGIFFPLTNQIHRELEKHGLTKLFEKFSNVWSSELASMSGAKQVSHIQSNEAFKKIAEILYKPRQELLKRAQKAGIDVKELEGYVVKQTHSKIKLKDMGFDEWYKFISPLLDKSKTDISRESLKKSYSHILKGKSARDVVELTAAEELAPVFHNMGVNIGSKQSRSLHFSNLENAYLYNNKFGRHSWSHQYLEDLHRMADKIATAENFGVHPEHTIKYAINKLEKEGIDIPSNLTDKLLDYIIKGRNIYAVEDKAAVWGQNMRRWKAVTSLGQMALSAIPDLTAVSNTLFHNGYPVLKSIGQSLKTFNFAVNPKERKKWLESLNVILDGTMQDMYSRMTLDSFSNDASGSFGKFTSKMAHSVYKMSGMSLWDASAKTATAQGMSNQIFRLRKSTFNKLPIGIQNSLKENGIDNKLWNKLKGTEVWESKYIVPDNIADTELKNKYQGFLIDVAHKATSAPIKSTDQQFLRMGLTKSNPIVRELAYSMMQFKTFPVMFVRHQLAPLLRKFTPLESQNYGGVLGGGVLKDFAENSMSNKSSILSYAGGFILATLALDYLSADIKHVLSGKKKFEDAFNPKKEDIENVLKKGSFLGIYQTLINGFTGKDFNAFTPPSTSIPRDALSIASKIGSQDFMPELLHKGKRNVPFNNMFFINGAINKSLDEYLKNNYPRYYRKNIEKRR